MKTDLTQARDVISMYRGPAQRDGKALLLWAILVVLVEILVVLERGWVLKTPIR